MGKLQDAGGKLERGKESNQRYRCNEGSDISIKML